MRENITKVAERGERLDSLQDKTGEFDGFYPLEFFVGCLMGAADLGVVSRFMRLGFSHILFSLC